MSSNINLHSGKQRMRYDPGKIVLMVVNFVKTDHLSRTIQYLLREKIPKLNAFLVVF